MRLHSRHILLSPFRRAFPLYRSTFSPLSSWPLMQCVTESLLFRLTSADLPRFPFSSFVTGSRAFWNRSAQRLVNDAVRTPRLGPMIYLTVPLAVKRSGPNPASVLFFYEFLKGSFLDRTRVPDILFSSHVTPFSRIGQALRHASNVALGRSYSTLTVLA